jgi:predicted DCC family thiol-disulfide oxidoreductase YuxK
MKANQNSHKSPPAPRGWILYDDACGFCRRWVLFWAGTLRRRGFEIAPLQADWVREKLKLNEAELLRDVRLLLPDGGLIQGADVYRFAMKRIWWAYPLYLLSVAPLFKTLFDWAYRSVANHRHCTARASGRSGRERRQ